MNNDDRGNNDAAVLDGELDAEAARELARVMEGIAGDGGTDSTASPGVGGGGDVLASSANVRRRPTLNKTGAVKQLVPRSSNPALNLSTGSAMPQRSGSLSIVVGSGGGASASGSSTPTAAPTSPSQTRRDVPASDVSICGWLTKKGQKRWFVLQVRACC